jgi:SRSO17 transposase
VLPANAPAWIDRLLTWLEPFESAFGHVAQRGAFRRYLLGVLGDSPRKSMSAMLARVSEPGSYQALQHFITDAPWHPDRIWRLVRQRVPAREGALILDGTSFPKQGSHSVGVARQYCGALGKIANCQVATTVALWTGTQAWLLGAQLYLPQDWLTPAARTRGRIPATVRFQEKWRHALTLLRQVRAAGFRITAVLGDAEFGDNSTLRTTLHRAGLPYALGISSTLGVFVGTPALQRPAPAPARPGRPRTRPALPPGGVPRSVAAEVARWPARQWRTVTWRNAPTARVWRAQFAALRVTPAHAWRQRRLAPEVWLLAERDLGATPRTKYYLVHLPATVSLPTIVRLAHQRWAIEQQYQELKDELGFDHFEGRTLPGWQRHAALVAVAYTFLQVERQRRPSRTLTLPRVRAILQEVLTAHFFVTRPHYLQRMLKLQHVSLRI